METKFKIDLCPYNIRTVDDYATEIRRAVFHAMYPEHYREVLEFFGNDVFVKLKRNETYPAASIVIDVEYHSRVVAFVLDVIVFGTPLASVDSVAFETAYHAYFAPTSRVRYTMETVQRDGEFVHDFNTVFATPHGFAQSDVPPGGCRCMLLTHSIYTQAARRLGRLPEEHGAVATRWSNSPVFCFAHLMMACATPLIATTTRLPPDAFNNAVMGLSNFDLVLWPDLLTWMPYLAPEQERPFILTALLFAFMHEVRKIPALTIARALGYRIAVHPSIARVGFHDAVSHKTVSMSARYVVIPLHEQRILSYCKAEFVLEGNAYVRPNWLYSIMMSCAENFARKSYESLREYFPSTNSLMLQNGKRCCGFEHLFCKVAFCAIDPQAEAYYLEKADNAVRAVVRAIKAHVHEPPERDVRIAIDRDYLNNVTFAHGRIMHEREFDKPDMESAEFAEIVPPCVRPYIEHATGKPRHDDYQPRGVFFTATVLVAAGYEPSEVHAYLKKAVARNTRHATSRVPAPLCGLPPAAASLFYSVETVYDRAKQREQQPTCMTCERAQFMGLCPYKSYHYELNPDDPLDLVQVRDIEDEPPSAKCARNTRVRAGKVVFNNPAGRMKIMM